MFNAAHSAEAYINMTQETIKFIYSSEQDNAHAY